MKWSNAWKKSISDSCDCTFPPGFELAVLRKLVYDDESLFMDIMGRSRNIVFEPRLHILNRPVGANKYCEAAKRKGL